MFSNCKAVILLIEDPSAKDIATAFIKICIHSYRYTALSFLLLKLPFWESLAVEACRGL